MERAGTRLVRKPWGTTDLLPWSDLSHDGSPIGEVWFRRPNDTSPDTDLLLKLLFANENLSVQVHPDDAFAHSIGLPRGKTEAWFVLSAKPGAKLGIGLTRDLTPRQFRDAIEDGSIAALVSWRPVHQGDTVFIPAGTIHAIGAGVVIAEIQQNSDTTFRIFDYGRGRELHVDEAVAVARTGIADVAAAPRSLTDARTLLIACQYFVLERIECRAHSLWNCTVDAETWLLVIEGSARIGGLHVTQGAALFTIAGCCVVEPGAAGLTCLVAYAAAEPRLDLLVPQSAEV